MHKCTVKCISKHLAGTSTYVDLRYGNFQLSTRGVVYRPDKDKGIECYIYEDFDGGWAQPDTDNTEIFILCTRYIIMYAGCPLLWCSEL